MCILSNDESSQLWKRQALRTSKSLVTPAALCMSQCLGGRAADYSEDWKFRASVSWGSARDISQGKIFWGRVLKNCEQSLKMHRPRCWQGGWCDPRDTGRAEQGAAAGHPPPWPLAAFCCCLAPASSRESSGRETSVLGQSLKPPLAWE